MQNLQTDTYHVLGNIVRFRMRSSDSGGAFSMVEVRTKPGEGAPPNRHTVDGEMFCVLSGSYEFMIDGNTGVHGAGSFVRVPDGKPHSFRNVGEGDATMIIVNWPGRSHEEFFVGVGEPMASGASEFPEGGGPPDIAKILSIAEKCGIEMLPA